MLRCILVLTLLLAWTASAVRAADSQARPNILFIFSDDHAQHAISAYGSKVNKTPHLDRLAAGGARFTNSFVTNSICTPSRATMLTGQYSHQNGVPVFNRFDGSRDNVAKRLQAKFDEWNGQLEEPRWKQSPRAARRQRDATGQGRRGRRGNRQ